MTKGREVNRKDMAEILGITLPTLDSWVVRGCPIKVKGSKGKQAVFNTAAVSDWRFAEISDRADKLASPKTIDEAKQRRIAAMAELAELELAEKRGSLISMDDALEQVEMEYTRCRQRLLSIPTKVAPQLVHLTNTTEISSMLKRTISEALRELTSYQTTLRT